jgi:hypothetical protein
VTVRVALFGHPVENALITLRGAGVDRRTWTPGSGAAALSVRPARRSEIVVRPRNVAQYCEEVIRVRAAPRAGVRGAPVGGRLTGGRPG